MGKRQYYVAHTHITLSPRNNIIMSTREKKRTAAFVQGMRSLFFDLAPHTDTMRLRTPPLEHNQTPRAADE